MVVAWTRTRNPQTYLLSTLRVIAPTTHNHFSRLIRVIAPTAILPGFRCTTESRRSRPSFLPSGPYRSRMVQMQGGGDTEDQGKPVGVFFFSFGVARKLGHLSEPLALNMTPGGMYLRTALLYYCPRSPPRAGRRRG